MESVPDEARGPEALLALGEDARALADCLAQLSASQRQSIMLAYLHGLTHAELAEHMREPLGTVKTWIRRGLDRLKTCMQGAAA